jgi:GAF domain-containing protein/PAS domain-containing protein
MDTNRLPKELETLKIGEHIACIYKDKTEQRSIVIPFILAGFKNNEKCIYIVDENTKNSIIEDFRKIVDIDTYLNTNQLELLTKEEAYLKEGYFDPDKMIELLKINEKKALNNGFSGLRVTGEMTWVFTKLPGVERLIEYEAKLNYFFPNSKCIALCQYNEKKFDPHILLDIIHTHPFIIIYNTLYKNPRYQPPDEFFAIMRGEIHWDTYEKAKNSIIQRKKIEEKTKKIQREINLVLNSMSEFVAYYGTDKRIKWVNKAAAKVNTNIVGKFCYQVWGCQGEPCSRCPVYTVWDSGTDEEGEISTPDGKIWHVKAAPVKENHEIIGVVEVARDITERKRVETQLKMLVEASNVINSTMDAADVFTFIADSVSTLVGFDSFALFVRSNNCVPVYTVGEDIDRKELVDTCMKTKETHISVDEMRSHIAVPLIIEDEYIGAFHLIRDMPHAYTSDDVAVLNVLSGVISSAVNNVQLHNKIKAFSKDLERRVQEKSKRREIILHAQQLLQREQSWKKGLTTIVKSIKKFGFERCGVFLVNQQKKTLEFQIGEGVDLPDTDTSVSLRDSAYFGVACVLEKKTVYVKDVDTVQGKQITPARSFVWVPIVVQNEAFAALAAGNISDNPITEEDVKDLEILAGMCDSFIDRTRMLIEPVAEKRLKTAVRHWLDPSECYLVLEKRPKKSFKIFVDLVTHGVSGFVISREHPEKIKRKYKLVKTPVVWLSKIEIENAVDPEDLPKLNFIIGSFTRKKGESVILLDGLEYLITQTNFQRVLGYLQELKDVIAMSNSRLIMPLHKSTLPVKEYSFLEREFIVVDD